MTNAIEVINPKLKTLQDLFMNCREQLALAIPDHMTPEKLIRLALTSIANTPALLECTPKSLFRCMLFSAEFGLEPGPFGLAYYVPFKNNKLKITEATFMPGYKGIVKLIRNSKALLNIQTKAVFANDEFHQELGLNPVLRHIPTANKDRGEITHFYCVVTLKDGGQQHEVMSRAEVEAHRNDFSQSYKSAENSGRKDSAWHTDFQAMGCKTVLLKTAKLCPINKDAQNVIALNEAAEAGFDQPYTPLTSMLLPPVETSTDQAPEGKPKGRKRGLVTSTKALVLPGYIQGYGNRPITDPDISLTILLDVLASTQKRLDEGYPANRKEMEIQALELAGGLKKVIAKRTSEAEAAATPAATEATPEKPSAATIPVSEHKPGVVPRAKALSLMTKAHIETVTDRILAVDGGKESLWKSYDNFNIDHHDQISEDLEGEFLDYLKDLAKTLKA